MELEQLDVKIAFLHGRLEEDILTQQLEGFGVEGKENFVCDTRSVSGKKLLSK